MVKLAGVGSVINGATPSSFSRCRYMAVLTPGFWYMVVFSSGFLYMVVISLGCLLKCRNFSWMSDILESFHMAVRYMHYLTLEYIFLQITCMTPILLPPHIKADDCCIVEIVFKNKRLLKSQGKFGYLHRSSQTCCNSHYVWWIHCNWVPLLVPLSLDAFAHQCSSWETDSNIAVLDS